MREARRGPREESEGAGGGTIRPLPTLGALYAGGGLARIDLKDRESAVRRRGARPRAKRPGRRTKDAPARLNCWPAEMLKCCQVQSLGKLRRGGALARSMGLKPWTAVLSAIHAAAAGHDLQALHLVADLLVEDGVGQEDQAGRAGVGVDVLVGFVGR